MASAIFASRSAFSLVLGLLVRERGECGLILGLYLLRVLARGGVLVIDALVRVHDLAYHVEIAHELRQALGAEDDGEVCILAVFLHRADVLLVYGQLLGLVRRGLLQLGGLLVHEPGVERDLLLYELQLLTVDLVLLVQGALLLQHAGLLVLELVYAGLHLLALGLELVALLLKGVYLGLRHGQRRSRRHQRQRQYHQRKKRRRGAQLLVSYHGCASNSGASAPGFT